MNLEGGVRNVFGRTVAAVAGIAAIAMLAGGAHDASAALGPGAVAPNFTKNLLGGGSASLTTYAGKVRLLFMLGWG